ncbi:hypothetical protein RMSM_00750 [Rhodopirellula maiorica SM1]|uniref:Secreted protein n=1 Tax=Rhodopirellula maiorica SM1 TaxID=1265738 RepID=M5RSJ9_9BACT|nr:hypothetical protein [Rhodopirellula maiorica]EMI22303.1 hypothetical protein RMSM_00750 [Rhodopirellula maiorica SM1]
MRTWLWIGTLMICFVSGGATCARREAPMPYPPPPVAFNETPSLDELAAVMNRTGSIQQLSTNTATVEVLTMPNIPKLSATLSLQRERRFRLRASLPIVLGAGMDMGSNDEVFWFEVPEGVTMSKTLYYAEHAKYRQQLQRAVLPVDPTWVMDALGLVQLDPATVVNGPVKRDDGKLEIRSVIQMPDGLYQRVYLIEPSAGYVTNQFMYSPDNHLIAQSTATNHRYYAEHQCALPHQVELNLTPAMGQPLSMKITIGSYTVNQLLSGDPQLFTMPQDASQMVDLTTLSATVAAAAATTPTEYTADLHMAMPLRGTMQ